MRRTIEVVYEKLSNIISVIQCINQKPTMASAGINRNYLHLWKDYFVIIVKTVPCCARNEVATSFLVAAKQILSQNNAHTRANFVGVVHFTYRYSKYF